MTITSIGYAGSVTDADWRKLASKGVGLTYGVDGFTDWKVSAGAGDRMSIVAPGLAFGIGVVDTSDAPISIQHATVASGSRWDLIVARRDWDAEETTVAIVQGSAVKAIPTRATGLGTVNEQPLALARVEAGKTAVQEYVDLRCAIGDGGAVAWDQLALQYLTRLGTSVRIGSVDWFLVTDVSGSPVWISTETTDTGWVAVTPGTGWESASGYPFEVRAVGPQVQARGALRAAKSTATILNLGTFPEVFRPSRNTFLGAQHGGYSSSGVHVGELLVSTAGLLSIPNFYYDGSLGVGSIVPVHGNWFRG